MSTDEERGKLVEQISATVVTLVEHMIAAKVKPDVAVQAVCSMLGKAFDSGNASRALHSLLDDAHRKGAK